MLNIGNVRTLSDSLFWKCTAHSLLPLAALSESQNWKLVMLSVKAASVQTLRCLKISQYKPVEPKLTSCTVL